MVYNIKYFFVLQRNQYYNLFNIKFFFRRMFMNITAKSIDEFCGAKNGYSRSITLRNALVPVGKTQENLEKSNMLKNDFERAKAYFEVKNFIDEFHRAFIEDVLSKTKLDWSKLYSEFDSFQSKKDKAEKAKHKKELEDLQNAARKRIADAFRKNPDFKKLFNKELFSELLPRIIENSSETEIKDKKDVLKIFSGFSTYFTGFHENRKNIYSDEAKSTAISYRIVNENFPKFYANIKFFQRIEKNFPKIISETEDSLKDFLKGKKLKDIFTAQAFNNVLTQSEIDFYNTIIGGVSSDAGTQKVQGLNEKINLCRQQLPDSEKNKLRGKMSVLYKQILSDRKTESFIPIGFENSQEIYDSVKDFKEKVFDKIKKNIKSVYKAQNDYDFGKIYVPSKKLTEFSSALFGHWSILNEGFFALEEEKSKKPLSESTSEKITKAIEKSDYSLSQIQNAFEKYCEKTDDEEKKSLNVKNYFSISKTENQNADFISDIEANFSKIDFSNVKNLQQEKEAATPIKDFLDSVINLYHYLELVDYNGEEEKDSVFYSKFDELNQELSEIIPLYNKVRNFVTKKTSEVKKIKLNFGCPTLANGWDENKESSNDAIILKKDGKYFLGIFNPKDKPKFKNEENIDSGFYEKMVYKLLPGPNKMLPKVFFSEKGKETFFPPKDILLGYEDGKHKKGEKFDKAFMQKLINWFKDAISRHEDWKNFNFKFSPTESYEDMSGFYKEVEQQGYKITFNKISDEQINQLVDSGKLYLFQIYNKDFADKSSGKKNLHTLYWENLFSKENLEDVCLKLNGEAELFFRPANKELKIIKHKKDSILVNRTTKDGQTIPENLYQEIYKYENKMTASISDKAKTLLDSGKVVCKKAAHEITKDRRFTQDTYLFHCPITMNFKAEEITGKRFNDKVLETLLKNQDTKIIGIDRGERNLIYLSLINQKGEIEMQKSMNLVEQLRNDKKVKVDYQEKLVQKEGERDNARKNWQTISNIKELKEGYLSNIVHEIAELMVKNNAIVVMEDLNFGFKRGRFAVERHVYQKFENMLIEKLNYLVFKDKLPKEPGGVLNAYQLTDKAKNVSDVYKQCGWLFYIPAAYTSKIDPKTGFVNMFDLSGMTNVSKKREFFSKFDDIHFNSEQNAFAFSFDYKHFGGKVAQEMYVSKWTVYSVGERISYSKAEKSTKTENLTENLKSIFEKQNIDFADEKNILDKILEVGSELKSGERPGKEIAEFLDLLFWNFKLILQMRNSVPNSVKAEDDYLISPVLSDDGTFFDTRNQAKLGENARLPLDADANGAYHIALKGLYLLQHDFNRDKKGAIQNIKNTDWFKFVQEKECLEITEVTQ